MKSSICRGCGEQIYWVETVAGKKMPLNIKPQKYVKVEARGFVDVGIVQEGFISHFATCPKADAYRKRKKLAKGNDGR